MLTKVFDAISFFLRVRRSRFDRPPPPLSRTGSRAPSFGVRFSQAPKLARRSMIDRGA